MQAQFSQSRPAAITPNVSPRMPLYPLGAPGIGQQLLYGQAAPSMIPQVIEKNLLSLFFHFQFDDIMLLEDLCLGIKCEFHLLY